MGSLPPCGGGLGRGVPHDALFQHARTSARKRMINYSPAPCSIAAPNERSTISAAFTFCRIRPQRS
ncbi:hypothetical protein CI1B_82390 [Bradyrhizobium ivorense]|uniref:Uncharacterized protein n=1 Tax=Bradyrhizobium ivorense TaxID=2511166 RepID=A0A508TZ79_9BRAD|nr:hypothetical protein CI1B_82390 [Bradyrhizobium ivorense]